VLNTAFIQELHCPYCASPLSVERAIRSQADHIEHGVVRCGCYHYPIIDGILILKQQSGPADTHDVRVAHLMAGEIELARHRAMHVDSPLAIGPRRWQRALQNAAARGVPMADTLARMLSRRADNTGSSGGLSFAELLDTLRPGLYGQYLYQRYANNSFLASVAPLLLLGDLRPGQRVLELTCGIGHSAFLTQSLFPHLQLVATDHDFVNLSIAKRYFVPDAHLVCLDAEAPLPFVERSFGAVFCLDGFHYLRSKVALISELDRVTDDQAIWLFPHLHNAKVENFSPGIPLSPDHYSRCFNQVPHRIYCEAPLLRDFHQEGALFLDRVAAADELAQAQNLTLIGTRRSDFWRARTDLAQRLSTHPGQLLINPIYRIQSESGVARLTLSWPSPRLRDECCEVEEYLPNSCNVDAGLLRRMRAGSLNVEDTAAAQELAQKFVLVNLPHAAYSSL
jgi:SAM-dependent methyltransferase/uncharacterized protein YbaR (Trm112 family)